MFWILAQGDTPDPKQGFDPSFLVLMGFLFLLMYFLFIRPQRKAEAKKREMLAAIKKNDRIVTNGGLIGVVTNVKDDELAIRIDENKDVKVRVSRSFVAAVLSRKDDEDEE